MWPFIIKERAGPAYVEKLNWPAVAGLAVVLLALLNQCTGQ